MTWNLWWLGHSASAWTSCWGPRLDSPSCGMDGPGNFRPGRAAAADFFPRRRGENGAAGALLAILLPAGTLALTFSVLWLAGQIHPGLRFFLEVFWGWQALAVRGLGKESSRVYRALREGTLEQAQQAVARIVGQDTQRLDRAGVTRAAVETVAENFSDGVAAPLFYFFLGGAPWPSAIRPSIPWTVWWGTGMNGISTLAAGRPGWTMEPTGFPPVCRRCCWWRRLGSWGRMGERCLADLAPGPAQPRQPQRSANRGGDGRSAGGSAGRTSLVFWDTGGKTDHWRASAPDCTRGYSAQ